VLRLDLRSKRSYRNPRLLSVGCARSVYRLHGSRLKITAASQQRATVQCLPIRADGTAMFASLGGFVLCPCSDCQPTRVDPERSDRANSQRAICTPPMGAAATYVSENGSERWMALYLPRKR